MSTYDNVDDYEVKKKLKELGRLEKKVGDKAAKDLEKRLTSLIRSRFEATENTGLLMRETKVLARRKNYQLSHIAIKGPVDPNKNKDGSYSAYGFMLNYGFEGVKSNGVAIKLKPRNQIADAIDSSKILEYLGEELTQIRFEEVTAYINFKTRG